MSKGLSDVPYYSIGSLPKLLRYIISLIDNEVLVEDLEDFAALKVSHSVSVCLVRYWLCIAYCVSHWCEGGKGSLKVTILARDKSQNAEAMDTAGYNLYHSQLIS